MEQKQIVDQADFRRGNLENVGGPIPLEKVKLWTGNYRKINDKTTTSHFFGRHVIEKILAQPGCVGIRMHYALDDHGRKQLILSGVDKTGRDQTPDKYKQHVNTDHPIPNAPMPLAAAASAGGDGEYFDQSWPCPETKGCADNA